MPETVRGLRLLKESGGIPEAQHTEFRENGHVLTRGLLGHGEMDRVRRSIAHALKKYGTERRKPTRKHLRGKAFLQAGNLWRVDEGVGEFVLSRRLAGVAASLLGVSNVRLYHDQALFKQPGEGASPWHQDQFYWPVDTPDTVVLWMPLTDISIEMGMIGYASGSHKGGILGDARGFDESDLRYRKHIKEQRWAVSRAAGMRAGDASWHYGATIHCTLANDSDRVREVMTVIYMADGARVTDPKNKWQVSDRENWLMDLPAGRLAASALNPLLL